MTRQVYQTGGWSDWTVDTQTNSRKTRIMAIVVRSNTPRAGAVLDTRAIQGDSI